MMIVVTAMTMISLATGCSSEDTDTKPTSSSSSGSSGKSSSLSLAFASKCARCHGTTATGQDPYPALPGTLTLAEFTAVVRAGRNDMPFFSASDISDADLAADYDWMKTQR